jgi:hypothetical protein
MFGPSYHNPQRQDFGADQRNHEHENALYFLYFYLGQYRGSGPHNNAWGREFDAYGQKLREAERADYRRQVRLCVLKSEAKGNWRMIPSKQDSSISFELSGSFTNYRSLTEFTHKNAAYHLKNTDTEIIRPGVVVAELETNQDKAHWQVYHSDNILKTAQTLFSEQFKDHFNKQLLEQNSRGFINWARGLFSSRSETLTAVTLHVCYADLLKHQSLDGFPTAENFATDKRLKTIMATEPLELAVVRNRTWHVWNEVFSTGRTERELRYQ